MVSMANQADPVAVLRRLASVVDELQRVELSSLSSDELLDVLRELEVQKRRMAAVDHRMIAEVDGRGLGREHGCTSTAVVIREVLRVGPGEAAGRVRATADLGPRRTLTGDVLPPVFPAVAAAQAAGTISDRHAHLITTTVDALPGAVQDVHDASIQTFLVEQAEIFDPTSLATITKRLTDTLNPDGVEPCERDRARRRDLTIRQRPDGTAQVQGELTGICAEALLTVLDSLARPDPADDGTPDPRTPGQRRHDGLQDGLLTLIRTGELPDCNGVAATILLTITAEQPDTGNGTGLSATVRTGHGAHLSLGQALTVLGDPRILPVAMTATRAVTGYGTSHRIFTENQRLAMTARDHGCSFPGCTVGPAWCQAHHITDFSLSRRTSIDDGTLLCGFHHREHQHLGWTCSMIDGNPHWIPPSWRDPNRTPRRNQHHQPQPLLA